MAKYLKKKKKKPVALIVTIVLLLVILVAVLAVFVLPQLLYSLQGGDPGGDDPGGEDPGLIGSEPSGASGQTAEEGVSFPISLDDGRLELASVFPFDGINPDFGGQQGENIASIEMKNLSGSYLTRADVTVSLSDGTQRVFTVTDLPAGSSVMAFSVTGETLPDGVACTGAQCQATYDGSADAVPEEVSVSVSGVDVTLTNTSGEALSQIVVYCRDVLDGSYFGGVTYSYTVSDLPAGESTTVQATDCIMGMAEVVRIVVN